jgi:hypothetical protein
MAEARRKFFREGEVRIVRETAPPNECARHRMSRQRTKCDLAGGDLQRREQRGGSRSLGSEGRAGGWVLGSPLLRIKGATSSSTVPSLASAGRTGAGRRELRYA